MDLNVLLNVPLVVLLSSDSPSSDVLSRQVCWKPVLLVSSSLHPIHPAVSRGSSPALPCMPFSHALILRGHEALPYSAPLHGPSAGTRPSFLSFLNGAAGFSPYARLSPGPAWSLTDSTGFHIDSEDFNRGTWRSRSVAFCSAALPVLLFWFLGVLLFLTCWFFFFFLHGSGLRCKYSSLFFPLSFYFILNIYIYKYK